MLTATNMRVISSLQDLTDEELAKLAADPELRTEMEQQEKMRH